MNDILNRGSYLNSTTTTTINGRSSSSATTTTPALTTTTTAARRGGGAKGRSGSGSRKSPTSLVQALDDNRDSINTSITATTTTGSNTNTTTMGSGMHSLAHELAVALMPEPSAGSKLLHEELGIEFDEGAEGIDELPDHHHHNDFGNGDSLAAELNGHHHTANGACAGAGRLVDDQTYDLRTPVSDEDFAAHFGSGAGTGSGAGDVTPKRRERGKKKPVVKPYEDPMKMLSNDLESTDRFLSQLRRIDADVAHSSFISPSSSSSTSGQASLEQYASDVIRHINDSVRDREGQVRQLVEYEREFRKIAGEVNGGEVLGRLDALKDVGILSDKQKNNSSASASGTDRQQIAGNSLETIKEDVRTRKRRSSTDWETNHLLDEEMNVYNDNDDDFNDDEGEEEEGEEGLDSSSLLPMKDSFIAPPPITGPPTIDQMLPHLVHVRSLSTSLSSSLTAMSEHAQVNGAANTDAGRKIRALKNKLGSWRSEWDSAEQSRLKIERWEAGLVDDINSPVIGTGTGTGATGGGSGNSSPRPLVGGRRIDARRIVEEHLKAFELALADAGMKTKAIMARS